MVKLQDITHLLRMAAVFAIGLVAFLIFRSAFIPKSFGRYGHFRGNALAEIAAHPLHYAGHQTCEGCHPEEADTKIEGRPRPRQLRILPRPAGKARRRSRHCKAVNCPMSPHSASAAIEEYRQARGFPAGQRQGTLRRTALQHLSSAAQPGMRRRREKMSSLAANSWFSSRRGHRLELRPCRHTRSRAQLQHVRALVGHAPGHHQVHRVRKLRARLRDGKRCSRRLLPHLGRALSRRSTGTSKIPMVDSPDGGKDGFRPAKETGGKNFFVPKLCNHCVDSPCTQVCPVGATFHTPDGVVLVDRTTASAAAIAFRPARTAAAFSIPRSTPRINARSATTASPRA